MTTPSTARKAGPFTGNGSQTSWPFTFKVFAAGDLKVTIANTAGTETVLTLGTDYTVSVNSNQDTSPGGTVSYLLGNGSKLTLTGDIDYDQPFDIPSGGNFNPVALENQLDRATMQIQQLAEQIVRAVKVPVTDDGSGELSGALAQGILALSPITDDITTVADNILVIEEMAPYLPTVADNVADISNFADVYQGGKAIAPTLRNDGSALQLGDMYFDTALDRVRLYTSIGWADGATATPVSVTVQSFSGNGSTTAFSLGTAPLMAAGCEVYISGVHQALTADFTVLGSTLNFTTAPPAGSDNIVVRVVSPYAVGAPSEGSVTTSKLADGAATGAKLGADVVKTTGNQTIAGVKTFTETILQQGASKRFVQVNDSGVGVTDLGIGVLTGNSNSIGLNNPTATGSVSIGTNNATRVHVTNDGKVGIGTTTPSQPLTVVGGAHIADTYIGPGGVIELGDLGSGDRTCVLDFHSSGAPSSVDFDARIIRYQGANNSLVILNMGTGSIDFNTGATTRMYIAASGRINMPNNSGARAFSGYPITTPNDTVANATRASGYIEWNTDIGPVGTTYFTSDIRKKENIAPSTYSSLSLVEQIEFVEFDWKPGAGEQGHVQVGVIAQQLQQLEPRLVAELSDGSLMIKEPALVTHLAKAIQEQQAIIKQLQADLAELKSRA